VHDVTSTPVHETWTVPPDCKSDGVAVNVASGFAGASLQELLVHP
jgi:hypothetical protein